MTTPVTMASVPPIRDAVIVSPSSAIANSALNSGAVEARVVDKVGPRNRIPAIAKFADRNGRNSPIAANSAAPVVNQYHDSRNHGESIQ